MAKTPAQLVKERLALAAQAQAQGNAAAAAAYAQAAANIKGSGQATVQAAAQKYADLAKSPVTTQTDTQKDTTTSSEEAYWANKTRLENQAAASEKLVSDAANAQERAGASAALRDMFTQYGLGALVDQVDNLVNVWGTNTGVIFQEVKKSETYKTRFKGLNALRAKGINDVSNEAEYIKLESDYRQAFRESGLQSFLGDAGTQAEQDAIANLAGNYSVSVDEVRSRITDAQRVVADTPQEVRDSLQRYYNVDPSTLVSYVLDPTKTASQVNRLANAAIIGGYGTRAGLDISLEAAGAGSDLAQGNDLNIDALQTDLAAARAIRDETKRLAEIEGKTLRDTEAFQAQLKTDAGAAEKVKALQSRERGRFGGSSGIGKGALSRPNTF